jgi:hypothetical protein
MIGAVVTLAFCCLVVCEAELAFLSPPEMFWSWKRMGWWRCRETMGSRREAGRQEEGEEDRRRTGSVWGLRIYRK